MSLGGCGGGLESTGIPSHGLPHCPPAELKVGEKGWKLRNCGASFTLHYGEEVCCICMFVPSVKQVFCP